MTRFVAYLSLWFISQAAVADGEILNLLSPQDHAVLKQLTHQRARVVSDVLPLLSPTEQAHVLSLINTETHQQFNVFTMIGMWECRFTKLGGEVPMTLYPWFQCVIEEDDVGLLLEKKTGSQRFRGRLYQYSYPELLFLGGFFYATENPVMFGDVRSRDILAVVRNAIDGRLLIEFPAPFADSNFEIVELRR
jgi:hypothetical protein